MTDAGNFYSSYIVTCVFNAFFSYTAIMLNIVTILALRKTLSLPTPLKTLLLSLAVSDLGVGLLVQPLYIARLVMNIEQNIENNPAYNTTNTTYLIAGNLFTYASFFGVVALSADRFLAIHLHLRYQELVTHKRVVAAVISIWVFSAFLSLITLRWIPVDIRITFFTTIEIACLVATALFYCNVYVAVRRHSNNIQVLQVHQQAQNGETIANAVRHRKSAVGTFYVYLVFLACYLPQSCLTFSEIATGQQSTLMMHLTLYTDTLVLLNSSLNPLIYCWKMKHIRHAVMDILRNIYPSHN